MEYVFYVIIAIIIIILIVLLLELLKTKRKTQKVKDDINTLNSNIDSINEKMDYVESVRNKTLIDEVLLSFAITRRLYKKIKKNKKPKNIVLSIAKEAVKDVTNKSFAALPSKLKQFH